jgi:hypothetical protein
LVKVERSTVDPVEPFFNCEGHFFLIGRTCHSETQQLLNDLFFIILARSIHMEIKKLD